MVPRTKLDPSQGWVQQRQRTGWPPLPSRQLIQTADKNCVRPSTLTWNNDRARVHTLFVLSFRSRILQNLNNRIESNRNFSSYLCTGGRVLPRWQEESAVHQWIPVENEHRRPTKDAGHSGPLKRRESGQDEASGVVIAVIALVFHLR